MKKAVGLPLGQDTKTNVAVQRPNVNLREAENVGEQASAAVAPLAPPQPVFAKHGTLFSKPHPLEHAFGRTR